MHTEMHLLRVLRLLLGHVFAVNISVLNSWLRVWITTAGYEYVYIKFTSAADW
jgi:hypothetical protein